MNCGEASVEGVEDYEKRLESEPVDFVKVCIVIRHNSHLFDVRCQVFSPQSFFMSDWLLGGSAEVGEDSGNVTADRTDGAK